MPIGTGKVGLFGGVGISIEAGSQTFNAPGTFTVPADLKVVSLSGNGAAGNPGNPGNPGGDGIGGDGGSGGYFSPWYFSGPNGSPVPQTPSTYDGIRGVAGFLQLSPNTTHRKIGMRSGVGGLGSGPPAQPFSPLLNPPGGPGNPGNAGGVTSALGYCWVGGSAGNGGTGGVDGSYGNPGANGLVTSRGCTANNTPAGPMELVTNAGGAGGTGLKSGGQGGGRMLEAVPSTPYNPCQTIYFTNGAAAGGAGGGGAGNINSGGNAYCPYQPAGITFRGDVNFGSNAYYPQPTTSANLAGSNGGGRPAIGGGTGTPCFPSNDWRQAQNGGWAREARAGGGGGGGGAATYRCDICCITATVQAASEVSSGGGGGGSGSTGNSGSGAGNPGNSGTPATFNCVSVSAGCYPIVVGSGGQITISWNAQ